MLVTGRQDAPMFVQHAQTNLDEISACPVSTHFRQNDIVDPLAAGKEVLCQDFTLLELPDFVVQTVTQQAPGDLHAHWDRWIM